MTPEVERQMDEEERRITTTIDITSVLEQKRDALMAHASQIEDSWFAKIPPTVAASAFGHENFARVTDTTGAPIPETDLFAGLRDDA
jgi:LmbE family N-acetylglucosaminyl deacetylase